GTAAPLGSVTVPMMLPDTACANPACLNGTDRSAIPSATRSMLLREVILRSSTSSVEFRRQQLIVPVGHKTACRRFPQTAGLAGASAGPGLSSPARLFNRAQLQAANPVEICRKVRREGSSVMVRSDFVELRSLGPLS